MKYEIQIFVVTSIDSEVGSWHNTAWGGDDFFTVYKRAEEIAQSNGHEGRIKRVRVLEVKGEFAKNETLGT